MDPLLLRPAEVAEMLAVSERKVYEMCANGTLPSLRIDRSVRVSLAALKRYVAKLEGTELTAIGIEERIVARRLAK